jgi:hypothetical protein
LQHDSAHGAANHDHEGSQLQQGADIAPFDGLACNDGCQAHDNGDDADLVHA